MSATEFDLWLGGIEGLGTASLFLLWDASGRREDFAEELYRMGTEETTCYLAQIQGLPVSKQELILHAREDYPQIQDLGELAEELENKKIRYYWAGDPEYPERFRLVDDPPFGIYVKGHLPEEKRPAVGIVGTRMASPYGREQARRFAAELAANGVQIISGMARGVDGIAGRGALDESDASFAVLGGGVDICYPKENKDLYEALCERGGVISEYRPGLMPQNRFFPARNRIISALSDIVLVVEARERSGTLITVDRALEQGKDVWAIPGRLCDRNSSGCNRLIRQGAGIALSPELLLEALGIGEASEEFETNIQSGRATHAASDVNAKYKNAQNTDIEGNAESTSTENANVKKVNAEESLKVAERKRRRKQRREEKEAVQMTFDYEVMSSAEPPVARAILEQLDFSTPRSLDDIAPQVSAQLRREVPFRELMRELTHLILHGKVLEIRVGHYVTAGHVH